MNFWLTDFNFSATGHAREDANVSKTKNLAPEDTWPAEITSPPTIMDVEKEEKETREEITTPSYPHEDTSKPKQEPNEAPTGGKSFCLVPFKDNSLFSIKGLSHIFIRIESKMPGCQNPEFCPVDQYRKF